MHVAKDTDLVILPTVYIFCFVANMASLLYYMNCKDEVIELLFLGPVWNVFFMKVDGCLVKWVQKSDNNKTYEFGYRKQNSSCDVE